MKKNSSTTSNTSPRAGMVLSTATTTTLIPGSRLAARSGLSALHGAQGAGAACYESAATVISSVMMASNMMPPHYNSMARSSVW
jgi:hypothetical protein